MELYEPSLDWANELAQSLLWTAKAWLITAAATLIVLVTVVIVLIGCGVAWTQVVNPFLKSQAEITAKTAETLLAIKDISQAVARTAEAQQQQAEAMAKMMERMEQRDRSGVR